MHPLLCWSPHLNIADCGHSPPLMGLSVVHEWSTISYQKYGPTLRININIQYNMDKEPVLYIHQEQHSKVRSYTIDNLFSAYNTCLRLLALLKSAMIFLLSQVINNYHWIQYWWQWLLSVWLLYRKYWNDCVKVAINHVVASGKTQEMSK